jgi:Protein of unknown function (DUF1279)
MLCLSISRQGLLGSKSMMMRSFFVHMGSVRQFSSSYTPMTKEEEEAEKVRVSKLTDFQKEMELRDLDRQLAKLSMLRGINTGELYTFRGKYKALARDYGFPFIAWYWVVWSSTFCVSYTAISLGLIDTMEVMHMLDVWTGLQVSAHVDPTLGSIGLAVALNEVLEPLRLPIVMYTTKPVVHWLGMGPKY